jgi:hypothetical protein
MCERPGDDGELWELLAAVASGPRAQAYVETVAAQLKRHAVELHLESPALADGHRSGTRQHRGD